MTPTALVNGVPELRLLALAREVGRAETWDEACEAATHGLEASIGRPCVIRAQDGAVWRTLAQSPSSSLFGADDRAIVVIPLGHGAAIELVIFQPETAPSFQPENSASAHQAAGSSTDEGAAGRERGAARALDPLDDPAWRNALGDVITTALQLVEARSRQIAVERRDERIDRFSRELLVISDSATLHRTIVEHLARAVAADIGAFAVFVPQDNALVISATHGYPAVLVEHIRIAPGEGVIGRVFATGAPIVESNVGAVPGHLARRRYRTDSYVALPLAGPQGVVAVVALTDKTNGGPFTAADHELLTRMAIPAALAVTRELLRDRTNDLAHLATVDALTGLFNRRYFETRVEQEIQRQRRQCDELSLLMLDLDNFKELNDTQGHLVGDVALKEVAEILRRAVRIFDVCARYGGEEFVILMPGAGSSTALRIAERIRRQVEQHFATGRRSGVPVPLTVSIGVSTASPSVTRDALVNLADSALLQAKATGKNQVKLYEPGGGERT